MSTCTECGQQLGVGRFCLNCGNPVDHADTAATSTARYPLYADEVPVAAGPPAPTESAGFEPEMSHPRRPSAATWLPLLAVGFGLVLFAGVGVLLLVGVGGDEVRPTAASDPVEPTSSPSTAPTPEPTVEAPPPVTTPEEITEEPQDLVRFAVPSVPDTAPASQDIDDNGVRYDAANLLDGQPETTWRMPGDATGSELTLTFPVPATLTRIGLINGYAKTAGRFDWYAGNRRIESVTWSFDDGTTVTQDLAEVRTMQSIDIEPVTTTTVRIRLDQVTGPGSGESARDNTAISDVLLVGVPA